MSIPNLPAGTEVWLPVHGTPAEYVTITKWLDKDQVIYRDVQTCQFFRVSTKFFHECFRKLH